jgi:hypothetical protein
MKKPVKRKAAKRPAKKVAPRKVGKHPALAMPYGRVPPADKSHVAARLGEINRLNGEIMGRITTINETIAALITSLGLKAVLTESLKTGKAKRARRVAGVVEAGPAVPTLVPSPLTTAAPLSSAVLKGAPPPEPDGKKRPDLVGGDNP